MWHLGNLVSGAFVRWKTNLHINNSKFYFQQKILVCSDLLRKPAHWPDCKIQSGEFVVEVPKFICWLNQLLCHSQLKLRLSWGELSLEKVNRRVKGMSMHLTRNKEQDKAVLTVYIKLEVFHWQYANRFHWCYGGHHSLVCACATLP